MKRHANSHQPELPLDRGKHGGARPNAGRKRAAGRGRVGHGRRPVVRPQFPLHVTVQVRRDVPRLRNFELAKVLRRAFVRGCNKDHFRICQFSIQGNHIHLIVEASAARWLARGVQGFAVRVARGVNGAVGRAGTVFDDRYHAEVITTPRQMRNTLCYVLQNARRHGSRIDGVDPFSSAWWFDGWRDDRFRHGWKPDDEPPVAAARSWLLTTGWRRRGLIDGSEVPAAAPGR